MPDRDPDDTPVIEHKYDDETPPSIAVIQAVCTAENIDPTDVPSELGFVLYNQIDPTALNTMLADGSGDGSTAISFDLSNDITYHVDISDDGEIAVQPVSTDP